MELPETLSAPPPIYNCRVCSHYLMPGTLACPECGALVYGPHVAQVAEVLGHRPGAPVRTAAQRGVRVPVDRAPRLLRNGGDHPRGVGDGDRGEVQPAATADVVLGWQRRDGGEGHGSMLVRSCREGP